MQFVVDWNGWNSRSSLAQTSSLPPFYHAALMVDAITLFTSTLRCRLQQMDALTANLSLAELTSASLQLRQQPSTDNTVTGPSLLGRSSCYLSGRLMYQHGAYQVRGLGAIAELRKLFVSSELRDGCEDMGLRGLTGDLKIPADEEERSITDLILWSAVEASGLQPVARVIC